MFGDLSSDDVELLNAYGVLGHSAKKDMHDYLCYLLNKQYKKELMAAIFNNQLIHSLLHSLLHTAEREDFDIDQIEKRIRQFKEIYFGIFEHVYNKYAELITDLDSYEMVKDFGLNSVEHILRACFSGNHGVIRFEIIELCENFNKLARKKDARKIIAV
ncbi:MAG: hypothetical protein GXY49_12735 [Syntrophomonadaceae bacterium]|nr:hypothetical protein [Syntrophomonadaceae bacterium]